MTKLAANDPVRQRVLEAIAREAGHMAYRYFLNRERLQIEIKGPQDLVSIADREVESLIRAELGQLFPDEALLGEEHGIEGDPSKGCWVIDPIDGTFSFLNGLAAWCVSIAYIHDGEPQIGVIYDPNTRELFSARRGGTATLNGEIIAVSKAEALDQGSVFVGYAAGRSPEIAERAVARLVRSGGTYFREGSGALGLAWTAAGRLLGYVEPHMMPWDCLAGLCLIEAAGGSALPYLSEAALNRGGALVAGPPQLLDELGSLLTSD